ncbi:MAG: hypothetical protein RL088_955 [Verrucomicrobiota bacterium]|jgi:uncharacterized membrane protein SpoIIM required for sporulation
MKRADFEKNNETHWAELEAAAQSLDKRADPGDAARVPALFRQVCGDLALAQHRMYGRKLCDRLNSIIISVWGHLHASLNRGASGFVLFFGETFPSAVRSEWRVVWLCFAMFWLPFAAFIATAYFEPKWIYAALGPEEQAMMDAMYGKGGMEEYVREQFGSNFAMTGFYIINNVSIAFRSFASGVLFGVGAIYGLGFQGVFIGAMFGYVHANGNLHRLYTFCASHSSFEILGIILCGAAGTVIGLALVKPGRLSRKDALAACGTRALPILIGGALMVALAAPIEGFWSPSSVPAIVKHTVGILGWLAFGAYFTFVGRGRNEA